MLFNISCMVDLLCTITFSHSNWYITINPSVGEISLNEKRRLKSLDYALCVSLTNEYVECHKLMLSKWIFCAKCFTTVPDLIFFYICKKKYLTTFLLKMDLISTVPYEKKMAITVHIGRWTHSCIEWSEERSEKKIKTWVLSL